MTPESITVSLEWAKKLKEVGYPQGECTFWWQNSYCPIENAYVDNVVPFETRKNEFGVKYIAAPTAEQILRRLPCVPSDFPLTIARYSTGGYYIDYSPENSDKQQVIEADTLANAAAAMYCYLAENNLLPS